jgi:hypothetical protein
MKRIANWLRIPLSDEDLGFIQEGQVDLTKDHIFAGNRMRMQSGQVALKVDEQWQTHMTPWQVRTVSSISWPLLRRYAYIRTGPGLVGVGER